MHGIQRILKARLILLGERSLMPGGFMICTGMFGNGVMIILAINTMKAARRKIPKERIAALCVSCVAVPGTTDRGPAVLLIATGMYRRTVAALSDFVCLVLPPPASFFWSLGFLNTWDLGGGLGASVNGLATRPTLMNGDA